jgi:hypothetical protein
MEAAPSDMLTGRAVQPSDATADLMFPGTSTIQTRLRDFRFVPWICARLEQDEVPANRFAAAARAAQLALVEPLLEAREEGIFGRLAGGDLKRLPADVYWGGRAAASGAEASRLSPISAPWTRPVRHSGGRSGDRDPTLPGSTCPATWTTSLIACRTARGR